MQYLGAISKITEFNITVIQVYAPTSNAEEAEVEWFYQDIQEPLELTPSENSKNKNKNKKNLEMKTV